MSEFEKVLGILKELLVNKIEEYGSELEAMKEKRLWLELKAYAMGAGRDMSEGVFDRAFGEVIEEKAQGLKKEEYKEKVQELWDDKKELERVLEGVEKELKGIKLVEGAS